jgi:hypothetical protein
MDRNTAREIENKLRRYYESDKKINSLKKEIKLLDQQIEQIDNDLRECNIHIEPESKSPSFEERVQTSCDGTSYAEREVMRVTELKIRRMTEKQLERERKKEQIDKIELDRIVIQDIVNGYSEELKLLIEYKYKKRLNEVQISNKMNISQSQINKKKNKVLNDILRWEVWNKKGIKEE